MIDLRVIVNDNYYRKHEPDARMVRCVLRGYVACAANCPEACTCGQMEHDAYETAYFARYRRDDT